MHPRSQIHDSFSEQCLSSYRVPVKTSKYASDRRRIGDIFVHMENYIADQNLGIVEETPR